MKISVIGLGIYSLAISKMLAKKSENKIVIWTENEKNYEEYKKSYTKIFHTHFIARKNAVYTVIFLLSPDLFNKFFYGTRRPRRAGE